MAIIYPKSTAIGIQNGVILDPAQALEYPFGFEDWTKIRVGMSLSYTTLANNNAGMDSLGTFSIPAITDRDRMYYGVKRLNSGFPSENKQAFVGYKSYGSYTAVTFPNSVFDHRNPHGEYGYIGVHHSNERPEGKFFDEASFGLVGPSSLFSATSGFSGAIIMYLEIINKGLSNQQIFIRYEIFRADQPIDTVVATESDTLTTIGALDFNLSGTPYEIPNAFFVYNPIDTLRLRVFNFTAFKIE